MTTYRVRVEAPTALALQMVTLLADADDVDLVSSGHPSRVGDESVELQVEVESSPAAIESAISTIRAGLTGGASISLVAD